jgi:hypothetical protein
VTAVVARWEGVLDDEKMMAFDGGREAAMSSAAAGQEVNP